MSSAEASGRHAPAPEHAARDPSKDDQKRASQMDLLHRYKGFVAGTVSGVTKCLSGHPFDTIKVRMQTSLDTQFRGPVDCFLQTLRKEGVSGFYKGVTPPLVGWVCMDSVMLGSLTLYRRMLNERIFNNEAAIALAFHTSSVETAKEMPKLPPLGHGLAGIMAGSTVSFIAAPIEHVKARLQVQYSAHKAQREYSGPVDCTYKLFSRHGIRGLYHGLTATLFFRSFFFFWWSSYDLMTTWFTTNTSLSAPAVNFWAGGLSAQVFWLTAYPSDVVKQRIMTDDLGPNRRFHRWSEAARAVYQERGYRGFFRGFVPSALRAFPANAMALVAFEGIMRALP